MRLRILSFIVLLGLLAACQNKKPQASAGAKQYELKGKVVSADRANHKVTIAHDKIGDYMEAMTMPFTVRESRELDGVDPGDSVEFRLRVTETDGWIDQLKAFRGAGSIHLIIFGHTSRKT